jgi:hypothetical protein
MDKKQILKRLENDEDYYGEFGRNYLSNSDISKLLNNPLAFGEPSEPNINFLVGGYFHTAILEPDKLEKYKVIQASTRNTKVYKELSGGEMCLLDHEVDRIELMRERLLENTVCKDLIRGVNVEYEKPAIIELEGHMWKGKADIVNHNEKLIIDLKTTSDLDSFKWNAKKYNYDSQAYIYSKLFGYEFIFIAIDKNTGQIGLFDCSSSFYKTGEEKVEKASEVYDLFYNTEEFDSSQYFINKTL